MTRAIAPVRDWYLALTMRERVLVGTAGVLAGALLLVYGVVLPLGAAHDAAHVRHDAAVIAAGRVEAGLDQLARTPKGGAGGGAVSPIVAAIADAEGIILQGNQPNGEAGATVAIPTAAPGAALAFFELLRQRGIAAEQVTISPAADGSVSVNATLRRTGS